MTWHILGDQRLQDDAIWFALTFTVILDFHTHVGNILPGYRSMHLSAAAPMPAYSMISSRSIEDQNAIFYRRSPHPLSFAFVKHAVMTLWKRKRTFRGMVIPNLLEDMRTHHIVRSVVLPIEYHDGRERSHELIQACQTVPGLIPFCSVHPKDPAGISKMHDYLWLGAKGLKLHPNFQQISPDDRSLFPLYEEYAPYRRPLIFHSGLSGRKNAQRRSRRTFSSLESIRMLPDAFPTIPFVLAHAGIAQYKMAIQLAQQYDNVYLELSGQPAKHIAEALSAIGPERLLFGTDWPFWRQAHALEAVRQAVKGDRAAEHCIFYGNAERLLEIMEQHEQSF